MDSSPPDLAPQLPTRWSVLILLIAVFISYFPVYRCGFVFDDGIYVTENEEVRDPKGLTRIWTSHSAYAYYPLTMTTFWLEYRLWRLSPIGYHIDNVLLHAGSAVLFFLLLRNLAIPGAFLSSSIFALHPVCVESVAWISERKNVLSLFFALLSILWWRKYENGTKTRPYVLSLVCFTLSLLAKIATAPLPVFLLLLSWWKEGGNWRKRILLLLPFFLVAFAIGSVCLWTERNISEAKGVEYEIPFHSRWVIAGKAFLFYLWKLVWPLELMTIYPRWDPHNFSALSNLYPLSVVIGMVGLFSLRHRIGKGAFTLSTLYLWALLPALGLVDFAYMRLSFVADHFQYHACLAPIAGFGSIVASRCFSSDGRTARIGAGVCLFGLACLGSLTWGQCCYYKDDFTLLSENVEKNPEGEAPRDHLAKVLVDRGEFAAAYDQYRIGVEKHPRSPLLRFGLAMAAAQQGQVDLAITHLRETLEIDPTYASAHHNIAVALGRLGEIEEAEKHFRETFRLDPDSLEANRDYALFLMNSGRTAEAVGAFERSLSLDPNDAPSHFNLGLVLAELGEFAESTHEFERALELSPQEAQRFAPHLAQAHRSLGLELAASAEWNAAVRHLQKSLDLWPRTAQYRADIAVTRTALEEARIRVTPPSAGK